MNGATTTTAIDFEAEAEAVGLSLPQLSYTVQDNDVPLLVVDVEDPLMIAENSTNAATVDVRLAAMPIANTTVNVSFFYSRRPSDFPFLPHQELTVLTMT